MSACIRTLYSKSTGYAQVTINGKVYSETHLVYCDAYDVPLIAIKGKVIRHTCDNPFCVNPDHLVLGTHKENTADMFARGRANRKPRLSVTQVEEIRAAGSSHYTLAAQYGVDRKTIFNVVNFLGAYK